MIKRSIQISFLALSLAVLLTLVPAALAAEEVGPAGALGINAGLLLSHTVNFVLVSVLLYFLMLGPMKNMIDARRTKIEKGLEDAAIAAQARRDAETEAQKYLVEQRSEAQKSAEESRQRAEESAATIRDEAKKEAETIRADARTDAESARDVELAGLRDQVVSIALALANRVIGDNLDAQKQKALVSDFFAKVPDEAKALSGEITVVSAMPLDDDEKSQVEKSIQGDSYNYTVDPNILGGLVIRSGEIVIDGCVRSSLGDLISRLR